LTPYNIFRRLSPYFESGRQLTELFAGFRFFFPVIHVSGKDEVICATDAAVPRSAFFCKNKINKKVVFAMDNPIRKKILKNITKTLRI